jgi:hypothetical protein
VLRAIDSDALRSIKPGYSSGSKSGLNPPGIHDEEQNRKLTGW